MPHPRTRTLPAAAIEAVDQFCENLADIKLWTYGDFQSLLVEIHSECPEDEEAPMLEIPLGQVENFCQALMALAKDLPSQD